jgi:hypothetical protein
MPTVVLILVAVVLIYAAMVVRAHTRRNRFLSSWHAEQASFRASNTWVEAEVVALTSRGEEIRGQAYGPSLDVAAGMATGYLNLMLQGRGRLVQVLSKKVIAESEAQP